MITAASRRNPLESGESCATSAMPILKLPRFLGRNHRHAPAPAAGAKPRTRSWVGIAQIGAVVTVVAVAVVFSRVRGGSASDGNAPLPARLATAPLVSVFMPRTQAVVVAVEATGTVRPRSYVSLTPQVGGRVTEVSPALRAGGEFAANETLLVIDPADFTLAVDQARADVAAALADLRLRQAESEAARTNYALLHPGEPVPDLVARVPQIEQSEARLQGAQARLAVAELDLSRTRFSLPFAGKVTEATAELGQMLARNQPFGQAFSLDSLEVSVPIAQEDLQRLLPAVARKAIIRSGELDFPGTVQRVSAQLDERTRFARLYVSFDGPSHGVAPGTFVDVSVDGPAIENAFRLPDASEQPGGHAWRVQGGRLALQELAVLGRAAEGLLVTAFDPGEGVVVGAAPGGREGLEVRVRQASALVPEPVAP